MLMSDIVIRGGVRYRLVRADHIKRLESFRMVDPSRPAPEDVVRREIAEEMGHEFAGKLLEFNKVSQRTLGCGSVFLWAVLDVIVPDGPPEASA
jgi:hypothetical protein